MQASQKQTKNKQTNTEVDMMCSYWTKSGGLQEV